MSLRLAVVGTGDVSTRYARGLALLKEELRVGWVFDIDLERLRQSPLLGASTRAIPVTSNLETATAVISREVPPDCPIIIATHTHLHVPYALRLLQSRERIAVEKPLTIKREERQALSALTKKPPRYFPMGYYLLEKGLPCLPVFQPRFRDPRYLDCLQFDFDQSDIAWVAKRIGRPRKVTGCILEGIGPAADLGHRPWVLKEGGGNTWETFFHLTCFLAVLSELGATHLQVARNWVGRLASQAAAEFSLDTGHYLEGRLGPLEYVLFAAKGVATKDHQRWLQIECDGGTVFMDFETCDMKATNGDRSWIISLRQPISYWTQLRILLEWWSDPFMPLANDINERALTLNETFSAAAMAQDTKTYARGTQVAQLLPAALAAPFDRHGAPPR